jgi:hypothetical protein
MNRPEVIREGQHLAFPKIQIRHIEIHAFLNDQQHAFQIENSVNRTAVKAHLDLKG